MLFLINHCFATCYNIHVIRARVRFVRNHVTIKRYDFCDGRFYYDRLTKTLSKYLHDRLEINDIRCIHQGREKKEKDRHFLSLNNLIFN